MLEDNKPETIIKQRSALELEMLVGAFVNKDRSWVRLLAARNRLITLIGKTMKEHPNSYCEGLTPEETMSVVWGHDGLNGELGNLGMTVYAGLMDRMLGKSLEENVRHVIDAFDLPSQLSESHDQPLAIKMGAYTITPDRIVTKETKMQAIVRCGHHVEHWANQNAHLLSGAEQVEIQYALGVYRAASEKVEEFVRRATPLVSPPERVWSKEASVEIASPPALWN